MKDIEKELMDSSNQIPETNISAYEILEKAENKERISSPKKRRWWIPTISLAAAASISAAIALPLTVFSNKLDRVIERLNGTHVNMEGVTGFGVWNAPSETNKKGKLSHIHYLNRDSSDSFLDDPLYDWEQDYDWDPTKTNVLVSFDEEGSIKEVVYEMTNDRGQVRQNTLGNAAAVYVSKNFTYVMYVDDSEWDFWKYINFAQETINPSGFHCHHERMQTIVIHNETGKVFPLKDIIPQVNQVSQAMNYTLQMMPTNEDYIYIEPMYGYHLNQWYHVEYDEREGVKYRYVTFQDYNGLVKYAKLDKYNQEYIFVDPSVSSPYNTKYITENGSLFFQEENLILEGDDDRMYAIIDNQLQVFGPNYQLTPVDKDISVTMESFGQVRTFLSMRTSTSFRAEKGYFYSMFGDLWKLNEDSSLTSLDPLSGTFPAFKRDGLRVGKEMIAIVNGTPTLDQRSINGELVKLVFSLQDGVPTIQNKKILDKCSLWVSSNRVIIPQTLQNNTDDTLEKYFLLNLENEEISLEFVAYRVNDSLKLVKPITEALKWN